MSHGSAEFDAKWQTLSEALVRAYPAHRNVFVLFNVGLTIANVLTGAPWWAVWPLLVTGLIFVVHYLIYKASIVDDAWVDERAADLHYKSYDQGHIDSIAEAHDMRDVGKSVPNKKGGSDRTSDARLK
ncbi:MAG: 2TM domain-containing protein [Hyphomicrobiaceae bacterium]